jgi:hypothetical protein
VNKVIKTLSLALLMLSAACMGNNLNSTQEVNLPKALTGQLFDAPLVNLRYHSENFTGSTSTQGKFLYFTNEPITFTLGNHHFKEVKAAPLLNLDDLFSKPHRTNSVVNLQRLLRSISQITQNNKLVLPDLSAFDLEQLDFSQDINEFAGDFKVLKLLAAHGNQLNPLQLVPTEVVMDQLQMIPDSPSFESYHTSEVKSPLLTAL